PELRPFFRSRPAAGSVAQRRDARVHQVNRTISLDQRQSSGQPPQVKTPGKQPPPPSPVAHHARRRHGRRRADATNGGTQAGECGGGKKKEEVRKKGAS